MFEEIENEGPESPSESLQSAIILRWSGVIVLCAAVLGGVLAFGAVEAWAWGAVWGLTAVSFILAAATWAREKSAAIAVAPILLLLVLLAATAAVQLAPVPAGVFALTGPKTARIYSLLFAGRAHGISLAPGHTLTALLKISAVGMAVFSVLVLARTRGMLITLAAAVVAAGVLASITGAIQESGGKEKIYGVRDLRADAETRYWRSSALDSELSSGVGRVDAVGGRGDAVFFQRSVNVGDVFGPYANSNHFGGLMGIALPVMLSLLLALLSTRRAGWGEEGGFTGSAEGSLVLLLAFALAAGLGAVFYSRSLGAVGGIAAGLVSVAAMSVVAGRARWWAVALLIVMGAAMAAMVFTRNDLAEIVSAKLAERREVWGYAWRMAKDFLIPGAGLGSYGVVAARYEGTEFRYLHAHNDFLEFLAEAGVIVALLAAAILIWQAVVLLRGAVRRQNAYTAALSSGAFGAMAAIAVHSLFDFNLRVPANALALAVVVAAGSVAARAYRSDLETIEFRERRLFSGRGKTVACLLAAFLVVSVAAAVVASTVNAQMATQRARRALAQTGQRSSVAGAAAELAQVSHDISRALRYAPLDAEARYHAAHVLWARSRYEEDPGRSARLIGESARKVREAARLLPSYTYYSMTANSLEGGDREALREWPMQSFEYRRLLAEMDLRQGNDYRALAEMREAVKLAVSDPVFNTEAMGSLVRRLLDHFGTYERITDAVPDSFGGHFFFARGLAACGDFASATEEYVLAAAKATRNGESEGLNERSAVDLAERLTRRRRVSEARELYEGVLASHPKWQSLRLSYANFLYGQDLLEESDKEVSRIVGSEAPDWLVRRALELRRKYQTR